MSKERSEYVQYIVVRKDLVEQMGYGKLAAQVAHASLGVLLEKQYYTTKEIDPETMAVVGCEGMIRTVEMVGIVDDDGVQRWCRSRFTKLVVYVKSKQALLNLAEKLDEEGIRVKLIYDACFTKLEPEEENGSTLTCMGVIPIDRDNVPKCLRKLQLLE